MQPDYTYLAQNNNIPNKQMLLSSFTDELKEKLTIRFFEGISRYSEKIYVPPGNLEENVIYTLEINLKHPSIPSVITSSAKVVIRKIP